MCTSNAKAIVKAVNHKNRIMGPRGKGRLNEGLVNLSSSSPALPRLHIWDIIETTLPRS